MFFSSNIDNGASWEYRRFDCSYTAWTPREIASASSAKVRTCSPFLPITIAVPVSWHIGSTPPAAMLALRSSSVATKRSLSDASGSSRIAASCSRCEVRR